MSKVINLPTLSEIDFGKIYQPNSYILKTLRLRQGDEFIYESEGRKIRCRLNTAETFKVVEILSQLRNPLLAFA